MANLNLLDPQIRNSVLEGIRSSENVERKKQSLRDYEIYNDRAYQYVYESLAYQLSADTANQMPIVSQLNIAKRVVDKKSSIYNTPPKRTYTDITENDLQAVEAIYAESGFNTSLSKSNKYFSLRNQSFIQVVPKDKTLKLRCLLSHNVDVIPDEQDPEKAYAYIVSSFDKSSYIRSDTLNQTIADRDDYKQTLERYQVWTAEYSFIMNGKGAIVSEVVPNPIGILPFVDIAKDKDFEFFVRQGQSLTDFTVDFNVAWSDLLYISRMQGYSVGVLSGDANLKPDNMVIGPNRLLFLPKNAANPDSKLELDFKNPSPNIEASQKAIEGLLATFLSTRGADVKSIQSNLNGSKSFSSAIERLLAMIEDFEATKDDFDLYKVVEKKLHKIVVNWLSVLTGTDKLNPEYSVTTKIVDSKIAISFHKPEMIETKSEQLANAKSKIDLGIADRVSVLSEIDNITVDQAVDKIKELDERKASSFIKSMNLESEPDNATLENKA